MFESKNLCLIAVTILAAGLAFIVIKWPASSELSFSQRIARHRAGIIYYILLFTIALPPLVFFFLDWFVPTFQLPLWFSICIVLSSATQYACTLVPEVGGSKTRYHRLFAGLSAVLLLPPLAMLILNQFMAMSMKLVISACLIVMLLIIFAIAKRHGQHQHFMLLQSLYFGAFFVPILLVTYWQ